MFICFFLVFGCFFCLFISFFGLLVDCCAALLMLISFYTNTASSSPVSGCVYEKRPVSVCYEWPRPSETLRGLYHHNIVIKTSQSVSVELWQAGLRGFHLRWDLLNVPWRQEGRAIYCFAYFLSLLLIDLAIVVETCMGLTQSCYVTEGFGMVLRYFGFSMVRNQSRPSVDPPRSCVNEFLHAR